MEIQKRIGKCNYMKLGGNKTVFESSKLQGINLRLIQSQPNQLISPTKIFLFKIVVFLWQNEHLDTEVSMWEEIQCK